MPLPPPPPWPPDDASIREAIQLALDDGSWGKYEGEHSARLIAALRERWSCERVCLCCSGTLAVELALRGVLVDGGEVIMAGYDFPGNFRAVEAAGALPVLVDLAPNRYVFDTSLLDEARSDQTRALLVSHLHGDLAPMAAIRQWADEADIAIVEDVCQAPGAIIDGRPAGGWGDVATLSFGGSKLLTAGRGGAVLTNDPSIAQRITIFNDRGNQAFPLSELQAAAVLPQLSQLAQRNRQRCEGVRTLQTALANCGGPDLLLPVPHGAIYRAAWRSTEQDPEAQRLRAAGAPVGAGFRGFAKRTSRRCRRVNSLPHANIAADQTLLLHHAALLGDAEYLHNLAAEMAGRSTGPHRSRLRWRPDRS